MKHLVALFLLGSASAIYAGIGSKDTMYVGGTLTLKEETEGKSSTSDEKSFVFVHKNGRVEIPYQEIDELEYGQKAGRRIGVAIMVSPIALLSKKRKHFLTINYKDPQGKQQAAVFELGKDVIRTSLASLEARSGRKVTYQDDEARKSGRGN
jgi:hypothetical protein